MYKRMIWVMMLSIMGIIAADAQSSNERGIRFGILAGVNYQNLNMTNNAGNDPDSEGIIGFHAGVNALIPIASEFYFQPGVLYTTKGGKVKEGDLNSNLKINYIELPLNFVYRGALGGGYVLIGFGPYAAYGIGGSAEYDLGSTSVQSDVEFKNVIEVTDPLTITYFKALDAGANLFAGYETAGGIFIQLNTQFGLLNISPEDKRFPDSKSNIKNTGFGLSVGYRF